MNTRTTATSPYNKETTCYEDQEQQQQGRKYTCGAGDMKNDIVLGRAWRGARDTAVVLSCVKAQQRVHGWAVSKRLHVLHVYPV